LEAPACFFVAAWEADFNVDFAGAFRLLLDWEVASFLVRAIVILSLVGAASRPYRGVAVLTYNNESVAVRFVRANAQKPITSASRTPGQPEVRGPAVPVAWS
jgi:hypothetical protein